MSCCCFLFFKQKAAYELRMSDWSSDVCSSDLNAHHRHPRRALHRHEQSSGGPGKAIATRPPRGEARVHLRLRPVDVIGLREHLPRQHQAQIGRASWRDRVWPDVELPLVAVLVTKNYIREMNKTNNKTIK